MQNFSYHEVLSRVQSWSLADQKKLLEDIAASIRQREPKKTRRSILEFEGMDQESWKDVDIREYLNKERDSWNG